MTIDASTGLVGQSTSTDGPNNDAPHLQNATIAGGGQGPGGASESKPVVDTALGAGKEVAQTAAEQATAVAGQAKEQLGVVVAKTKDELRSQLDARSQQAASGLNAL